MHDYAAGKVEWLAYGLPTEGVRVGEPTAGSLARSDVATCALAATANEARRAIAESPYRFALVLGPGGVVLGRVRESDLEPLAAEDPVEPIMHAGPSTVRPHKTPEWLHKRLESLGLRTLVVTRPDGTLVGVVRGDEIP